MKIVFIGAGSLFGNRLSVDVLSREPLQGSTLRLCDLHEGRLETVRQYVDAVIDANDLPARVVAGTDRRELLKEGRPVGLTAGELDLLQVLTEHPNRVLDRDRLLDLLKGYERSPFDRSIDVQVARLRAKIEPDTKRPRYIRTVWGKGYMFTPQGEP